MVSSSSPTAEKPSPQSPTRMNSTNLYVTTTQIILKADALNPQSWQENRLVPYLRNSLCCVVCSMLLVDPLTPAGAQCQHHVCRKCRGGRKKLNLNVIIAKIALNTWKKEVYAYLCRCIKKCV